MLLAYLHQQAANPMDHQYFCTDHLIAFCKILNITAAIVTYTGLIFFIGYYAGASSTVLRMMD